MIPPPFHIPVPAISSIDDFPQFSNECPEKTSIFRAFSHDVSPKKTPIYPGFSHDSPKNHNDFPAFSEKMLPFPPIQHHPTRLGHGFGFLPGHGPKDLVVQGLDVLLGAVVRRPAQREGSTQAAVDQHGVARLGRSGTLGHGDLQRGMAILKEICIDYMYTYIYMYIYICTYDVCMYTHIHTYIDCTYRMTACNVHIQL